MCFRYREMAVKKPSHSVQVSSPITSGQGEFERECCQLFGEVVEVLGVPYSVGQIYGILFASPRPLNFSDIVERL